MIFHASALRSIHRNILYLLAEGEDKARALRDAKLDSLRQSGMQLLFNYLAPFVLLGDGGSRVSFEPQ
jgi:hypothetical protein